MGEGEKAFRAAIKGPWLSHRLVVELCDGGIFHGREFSRLNIKGRGVKKLQSTALPLCCCSWTMLDDVAYLWAAVVLVQHSCVSLVLRRKFPITS